MAYAVRRPAFGQAWRLRVIDPPRQQLVELLRRAVAEGQLTPDLDVEATAVGAARSGDVSQPAAPDRRAAAG